jgi:hypothetical protein
VRCRFRSGEEDSRLPRRCLRSPPTVRTPAADHTGEKKRSAEPRLAPFGRLLRLELGARPSPINTNRVGRGPEHSARAKKVKRR